MAFSATGGQLSGPTNQIAGRDALYEVDGVLRPPSASNVIEDAIAGVRVTLKGTTTDPVTVNVSAPSVDRTKVKEEIKQFVDAYNAVVTATRAKTTEKRVQTPTTQTDFNKGAFFGDTGLNSMLSKLREAVGKDYVPGAETALDALRDIGISTGKPGTTADTKAGLLVIDDAAAHGRPRVATRSASRASSAGRRRRSRPTSASWPTSSASRSTRASRRRRTSRSG